MLIRHPDATVQFLPFYVNDAALADLPAARRLIADMVRRSGPHRGRCPRAHACSLAGNLVVGIRAPLFAIAGEREVVVPPERSWRLFDAWGGPKRWVVIPGANHDDLGRQRPFWEPIRAFLDAA